MITIEKGICSEYPLLLFSSLAELIGLNESIVLQQIHYWICINFEKEQNLSPKLQTHLKDGRWWVYNSIKDWRSKNFPFWSDATITRILSNLEKTGIVIATNKYRFPRSHPADRTKWYTIDYDKLLEKYQEIFPGYGFQDGISQAPRQIVRHVADDIARKEAKRIEPEKESDVPKPGDDVLAECADGFSPLFGFYSSSKEE